MNTCQSCRFMAAPRSASQIYIDDAGDFIESEHATCTRIIHGNGDNDLMRQSIRELAIVTDGSGYAARLRVLPEFGCVLHEMKGLAMTSDSR